MSATVGIVFDLDDVGFDPYGRVMISDQAAVECRARSLST